MTNHCENCSCLMALSETGVSIGRLRFCDQQCASEYEQDNLGYAVQLTLPIKEDENQLELEGV